MNDVNCLFKKLLLFCSLLWHTKIQIWGDPSSMSITVTIMILEKPDHQD